MSFTELTLLLYSFIIKSWYALEIKYLYQVLKNALKSDSKYCVSWNSSSSVKLKPFLCFLLAWMDTNYFLKRKMIALFSTYTATMNQYNAILGYRQFIKEIPFIEKKSKF